MGLGWKAGCADSQPGEMIEGRDFIAAFMPQLCCGARGQLAFSSYSPARAASSWEVLSLEVCVWEFQVDVQILASHGIGCLI